MFSAGALRERKRAETSDQGLLPTNTVTDLIVQFGLPSIGVDGPHCDRDTLPFLPLGMQLYLGFVRITSMRYVLTAIIDLIFGK